MERQGRRRVLAATVAAWITFGGLVASSTAEDLTRTFTRGMAGIPNSLDFKQFIEPCRIQDGKLVCTLFVGPPPGGALPIALAGAVSQAVTQQFPLAAVSPAFTYHYNPTLTGLTL